MMITFLSILLEQRIANCVPRHTGVPREISSVPREKPEIRYFVSVI